MKFFIVCLIASLIGAFLGCCIARADDINWDNLAEAVIEIESGGDPNAVSPAGAIGLMQITPIVVKEWNSCQSSKENMIEMDYLYNPKINKMIGEWYLLRLSTKYGCDTIEEVLAAYNGGITRLRRNNWDISKMPKETRDYVRKVIAEYNKINQ